jgi:hypothetical protein
VLRAAAIVLFLSTTPGAWTQFPPQPPAAVGSTLGASLRNAAAATQAQAEMVRRAAADWGRRAKWASYRVDNFQQDYANTQFEVQMLWKQFNWMGNLALQASGPHAGNALAELEAGLNIIAELFTFLETQFNAGALDQKTIVRTCGTIEDVMGQWERELKKSSSRIGLVW